MHRRDILNGSITADSRLSGSLSCPRIRQEEAPDDNDDDDEAEEGSENRKRPVVVGVEGRAGAERHTHEERALSHEKNIPTGTL